VLWSLRLTRIPALVASYARSRGLPVEATPITRYPLDVRESPMVGLVRKVDAAVIVWPGVDAGTTELLALLKRKGLPVHVVETPQGEGGPGKNRSRGRCGW
jgi:hypothetical protein